MNFDPEEIAQLTRQQLEEVVKISNADNYVPRNKAGNKARKFCYEHVVGQSQKQLAAVNGMLRAIRRDGPKVGNELWPTWKTAVCTAVAEDATVAELARDILTKEEYALLTRPLAYVLPPTEPVGTPIEATPVNDIDDVFGGVPEPSEAPDEAMQRIGEELAVEEDAEPGPGVPPHEQRVAEQQEHEDWLESPEYAEDIDPDTEAGQILIGELRRDLAEEDGPRSDDYDLFSDIA